MVKYTKGCSSFESAVCISVEESRGALCWLNVGAIVLPAFGEAAGDVCFKKWTETEITKERVVHEIDTSDPARELALEP